jgi:F0F1-type ATP synthase membrane subunit b/b'
MEILILIAVIATGASSLYVAYTFKVHTERHVAPLMQRITKAAHDQIESAGKDLRKQIQESTEQLSAATGKDLVTSRELSQQVRTITSELRQDREMVRHLAERIDTRQDQFGRDLLEADRRVAQLGESVEQQLGGSLQQFGGSVEQINATIEQLGGSLDRQIARLAAIYSYVKSQGQPTGLSREKDQLILAMREAESHAERMGWGISPHLYALSEKIQPEPADHESSAEPPDPIILVAQRPLPDGNLVEALTSISWPEGVVGCVLVAELTDLPARGDEDEPIDPVATGQWASGRPDGRPARLAVAVRRNGEHVCGLRVKDEYDVQIRPDIAAGKIVAALLGTF